MRAGEQVRRWSEAFAERTRADIGEALAGILALSNATGIISFSGGFPDPSTFPGGILEEILHDLLASGDPSPWQYAPTRGLPGPLDYVAGRLERLDGQRPTDGELLLTSGGIEALELLSKSFLDPGDIVAAEGPTYLGAIMAFRSYQARVLAIPMDAEGLRIDALEDALASGVRPKFLYTIPDHQNPAGVSLSLERRQPLVDLARRYGLLVVEDVAYRDLGFDEERSPSLWSLGPDVVLQAGTFSKTFFPGVRLGWGAGPSEVVARMISAKQNTDQCASALGQRLLEEYGRRGGLDEGILRARSLYRRRGERLLAAMDAHMPVGTRWTRPRGGFFSWVTLPRGLDGTTLARRGMDERVAFVPGESFYPDGRGRGNIRLSFSRVSDEDIDEGARRLGDLVRRAMALGSA